MFTKGYLHVKANTACIFMCEVKKKKEENRPSQCTQVYSSSNNAMLSVIMSQEKSQTNRLYVSIRLCV